MDAHRTPPHPQQNQSAFNRCRDERYDSWALGKSPLMGAQITNTLPTTTTRPSKEWPSPCVKWVEATAADRHRDGGRRILLFPLLGSWGWGSRDLSQCGAWCPGSCPCSMLPAKTILEQMCNRDKTSHLMSFNECWIIVSGKGCQLSFCLTYQTGKKEPET